MSKYSNFINLTGHNLNLPGGIVLPGDKSQIARVVDVFSDIGEDGIGTVSYGEIVGLPEPTVGSAVEGIKYVVSAMVLSALKEKGINRLDVVAPATGHPLAVKNEKGHILEVPGFVRRA